MVNFEKCNEMKKSESVTVPIITAVYMNKVKQRHVGKVRRRRIMIISLTRSHSWDMKRPEGNEMMYIADSLE
jgi:hypothetical protein